MTALAPPKTLQVTVHTVQETAYWPDDGTAYAGYAYRWRVHLTVIPQFHSDPNTPNPMFYDGTDIHVGDWLSNRIGGLAHRVVALDANDGSNEVAIVEDVDQYNTYADNAQYGDGSPPAGQVGFVFSLDENNQPVFMPNPDQLQPQWQADLISRFNVTMPLTGSVLPLGGDGYAGTLSFSPQTPVSDALQSLNAVLKRLAPLILGVEDTPVLGKFPFSSTPEAPLPIYGSNIWTRDSDIPSVPPRNNLLSVSVYDPANPIHATMDVTGETNRVWLATYIYNTASTRLTDWIPPTFGSLYAIQVFIGNPAGGPAIRILPDAVGEEWMFDYPSGILRFANTVPTPKTATIGTGMVSVETDGIYLTGYRYVGPKGIHSATFTYSQPNPMTTWIIPHNLNSHPAIAVVDLYGRVVEGDVLYYDENQIVVTFAIATAGVAYLN